MKIRAAVLTRIGAPAPYVQSQPLALREVELEPPGPGELLVRVRAAGLCHSDLSVVNGDRPRPVPMVLGHESAGEVVECGPGVTDLRPGDRVVMVFMPSCGCCLPCAEGRPALCEPGAAANGAGALLSGARRLRMDGEPVHHHLGVSCFADHAVVSRRSCIKVEAGISFAEAVTVFQDPLLKIASDTCHEEERFFAIGRSLKGRDLLVVHCYREKDQEERIRIISARKLMPKEKRHLGGF